MDQFTTINNLTQISVSFKMIEINKKMVLEIPLSLVAYITICADILRSLQHTVIVYKTAD